MSRVVTILGLLVAWAPPGAAQPDPALEGAIAELGAALRPADGAGSTHRGDFDGDGRDDVALVLTDGTNHALAVLHARPDGYRPRLLNARLPTGGYRLGVVPPGTVRVVGPRGSLLLSTPAIELVLPGRSSVLYVWEGDRYRVYATETYAARDGTR